MARPHPFRSRPPTARPLESGRVPGRARGLWVRARRTTHHTPHDAAIDPSAWHRTSIAGVNQPEIRQSRHVHLHKWPASPVCRPPWRPRHSTASIIDHSQHAAMLTEPHTTLRFMLKTLSRVPVPVRKLINKESSTQRQRSRICAAWSTPTEPQSKPYIETCLLLLCLSPSPCWQYRTPGCLIRSRTRQGSRQRSRRRRTRRLQRHRTCAGRR